ncbi:hypothetical protein IAT38_003071 [Cryptococcus sp. DSM 104549]
MSSPRPSQPSHLMIDPTIISLPQSTSTSASPPDGYPSVEHATHQPQAMSTGAVWGGSLGGGGGAGGAGGMGDGMGAPMTPLWPFELYQPPAEGLTDAPVQPSPSSYTYPFTSQPSSFPSNLFPTTGNSPFGQAAQTPTTATTQWSQPSAIDPTCMPPAPPDTASLSSPSAPGSLPFTTPFTGLSPMFSNFHATTPSIDGAFSSPPSAYTPSRPGPLRGNSASSSLPTTGRRRSNTLMTLTSNSSASPATPTSGFNTYPYPSPRAAQTGGYPHSFGPSSGAAIHPPRTLIRQPSAPLMSTHMADPSGTTAKRVFHPSPASSSIGVELSHLPLDRTEGMYSHRLGIGMGAGAGVGVGAGARTTQPAEVKPPRFKPTKEQLEILIRAYDENKNPDGPTREALAKRLGPDVRPKTLQIWFQNRRSKSRAKERDANLPKPLHMDRVGVAQAGLGAGSALGMGKGDVKGPDWDALRTLIHDDDAAITILPVSVLSIASWTRFLTPGTGTSHPDLACAIRFTPHPQLSLYVVHKTDTFRIEIPLIPAAVSGVLAAGNPGVNAEAVAIKFELAPGVAGYANWDEGGGGWKAVGDFTGGETTRGGKCELTGDKEHLIPAFTKVQQLLAGSTYPTPISSAAHTASSSLTSVQPPHTASNWHFPTSASTAPSSNPNPTPMRTPTLDLPLHRPASAHTPAHAHQRQRSFSQPPLPSSLVEHGHAGLAGGVGGAGQQFDGGVLTQPMQRGVSLGSVPAPLGGPSSFAFATPPSASAPDGSTAMHPYDLSLAWSQLTAQRNDPAPGELEQPGTGMGWGFSLSSGALHTPLTGGAGNTGQSGHVPESSFTSFSTATLSGMSSTLSSGIPPSTSSTSGTGPGAGVGNSGDWVMEVDAGHRKSQSSSMEVATPPFELEYHTAGASGEGDEGSEEREGGDTSEDTASMKSEGQEAGFLSVQMEGDV